MLQRCYDEMKLKPWERIYFTLEKDVYMTIQDITSIIESSNKRNIGAILNNSMLKRDLVRKYTKHNGYRLISYWTVYAIDLAAVVDDIELYHKYKKRL